MRVFLVLCTVLIQVGTSLILDRAAMEEGLSFLAVALIGSVVAINGGRFLIWGRLHQLYDLSDTYPLIALFFPLIFIVALVKGEGEMSWPRIAGVLLILFGFLVFERGGKEQKRSHPKKSYILR